MPRKTTTKSTKSKTIKSLKSNKTNKTNKSNEKKPNRTKEKKEEELLKQQQEEEERIKKYLEEQKKYFNDVDNFELECDVKDVNANDIPIEKQLQNERKLKKEEENKLLNKQFLKPKESISIIKRLSEDPSIIQQRNSLQNNSNSSHSIEEMNSNNTINTTDSNNEINISNNSIQIDQQNSSLITTLSEIHSPDSSSISSK